VDGWMDGWQTRTKNQLYLSAECMHIGVINIVLDSNQLLRVPEFSELSTSVFHVGSLIFQQPASESLLSGIADSLMSN
jgi:hypothetical protein